MSVLFLPLGGPLCQLELTWLIGLRFEFSIKKMMPLLLGGSVGKVARRSLCDLIVSYGGSGGKERGDKARQGTPWVGT